jgi:hypothetical protein
MQRQLYDLLPGEPFFASLMPFVLAAGTVIAPG